MEVSLAITMAKACLCLDVEAARSWDTIPRPSPSHPGAMVLRQAGPTGYLGPPTPLLVSKGPGVGQVLAC